MDEYLFFNRILSDKFRSSSKKVMIEDNVQKTSINDKGKGLVDYELYRFDSSDTSNDFLAFFDKSDNAPKHLRAFCDYIMLAQVQDKFYVLLIELKSGDISHATEQLRASELFVNYIKNTIERIKAANHKADDLDTQSIIVRKIIVKKVKMRPPTNFTKSTDISIVDDHFVYKTNVFDITHICRGVG